MNMKSIVASVIVIILIGLAVVFWPFGNQPTPSSDNVAATFKGGEITRDSLAAYVAGLDANPQVTVPAEDQVAERADFEKLALNQMINEQLFAASAQAQGFTISDEAIQARLDEISKQFADADAYQAELAKSGLSEEQLRGNIKNQLTIEAYYQKLSAENNITVSPEEIKAFYDEQVTTPEENPLDSVSDQIEQFIAQQKLQKVVDALIEKLRETADIQILI